MSNNRRAYTLVEMLVTMAVLGLAAAVIVPNMLEAGTLGVQAAARTVIADILIAQNDAIAAQATRKVIFDPAGNSYRITDAADVTITEAWRNGATGNATTDFDDDRRFGGVEIEAVSFGGSSTELEFDALGAPQSGGTVILKYKDERYEISVAQFTGRVSVAKL